ncbi:hypothetical protein H5410_005636 [Solanum commersonii]|uniref:Uncharacterized protein n=1 Tax=Solanum commersonii TaxID=4109 RepID=A0A9J6A7X2_SOLCO|nr:hypothetical protein H5410_005636 [Solanum commersonii]
MTPLYPTSVDITRTKGTDTKFGPTLTTVERHRRDELIMARMYGLEMLCHQNGCHASTDMQLGEVGRRYPLNDHAKALLGIGPEFRKSIDNDIPTDEKHACTSSDVDFDSEEKIDPAQAGDKAEEELNIEAVLKSAMRKSRSIMSCCRCFERELGLYGTFIPALVTRTKGLDTKFGPTLTIAECHRRDDLIMARMYGLEMLRYQNDCWASTNVQLGDAERRYSLNAHAKALLGIGPRFHEPIDDDILTDEERLRTSSDVESKSDEEEDPP